MAMTDSCDNQSSDLTAKAVNMDFNYLTNFPPSWPGYTNHLKLF